MGIFIGDYQTSSAAKCGLMINWAVRNIINPALKAQYPSSSYEVKQVVGIDTSELRAARIGVRGGNDLVPVVDASVCRKLEPRCSPESAAPKQKPRRQRWR